MDVQFCYKSQNNFSQENIEIMVNLFIRLGVTWGKNDRIHLAIYKEHKIFPSEF